MLYCWIGWPISIKPWSETLDGSQKDSTISERNFKLHAMLPRKERFTIDCFSDADWGGDIDQSKSTSGCAFLLNDGAIL